MPSKAPAADDWSDSDDEVLSDVETAVQLGVPDGPMSATADLRDAAVSRIGGIPAFLAHPPPPDATQCTNCARPMRLLVQVWCPLEGSAFDRALYVWACAAGACQRTPGSVRAWRALRYNQRYADKLARKLAKDAARRRAEEEAARKDATRANPFSFKAVAPSNPFDLGTQVFGAAPLPEPRRSTADDDRESDSSHSDDDDDEGSDEGDAAEDIAAQMASTTIEDSPWAAAPAYPPLYLSTVSEYLPAQPKRTVPAGAAFDEDAADGTHGKDGGWALEGYENSLAVDHVFERFSQRVAHEGAQCLRYERGGVPLPFASDAVFDALFPLPPAVPAPVTRAAFMVVAPQRRTYRPDAAAVRPCAVCGARRVFECQLMPNLINVLKAGGVEDASARQTDEERRKAVLEALQRGRAAERVGMEWGTCMVFSCEEDCAVERRDTWREELVLVQWDD
ncbi:programmed cell death protein 2 [Amylocystis lapponica]|nr:programmed cell death protein 2 [Amylocystis lapponica]